MLKRLLAHPLTRGLDIDDPNTTVLRQAIVHSKPFLKSIYEEWYQKVANCLPDIRGNVLELGSGAGFLADYIPDLITSEILHCPKRPASPRWAIAAICQRESAGYCVDQRASPCSRPARFFLRKPRVAFTRVA